MTCVVDRTTLGKMIKGDFDGANKLKVVGCGDGATDGRDEEIVGM